MSHFILDVEIPEKLSRSGKKGSERLKRLERRLEHLRHRISISIDDRAYDKAEASALKWAIETILKFEDQEIAPFKRPR